MNNTIGGPVGPIAVRRYVWVLMLMWTLAIGAALAWELVDECDRSVEAVDRAMLHRSVGYGMLWLIGLAGLVVGGRRLVCQMGHCRHVEEALVDTLNLAQETAKNMPGVAYQFRLRPDGTYWFPYVSEGVTKMLGVTPRQVREDPVAFFPGMLFEEDVDAIFESIDESVENLSIWQREMRIKSADGPIKWVRVSSSPHVMPDKTVLFDGVFVDITDNKEIERKLQEANELLEQRVAERTAQLAQTNRELQEEVAERRQAEMWLLRSEQRFRSYFEQGLIGMAILSPDKEWEEVNARLGDMLGYSEEELVAKSWAEITHPDDRAHDEAQFDRTRAGILHGFSLDRRFLHKDGRTINATLSVKCLRGSDGKVDCLVVLVQDNTSS